MGFFGGHWCEFRQWRCRRTVSLIPFGLVLSLFADCHLESFCFRSDLLLVWPTSFSDSWDHRGADLAAGVFVGTILLLIAHCCVGAVIMLARVPAP
jgi:hypothetical protein